MLTSQKRKRTFAEAMEDAVDFRRPLMRTDTKLFSNFADAVDRYKSIGTGLSVICRDHLGVDIQPPPVAPAGAEVAALPYEESLAAMVQRLTAAIDALTAALAIPQVGRIEWTDEESCRFTYFEVERQATLMTVTTRRIAHTHHLVKARMHRLPAKDVAKPVQAVRILSKLPAVLIPHTRIVTGLEVIKDTQLVSEETTETEYARSLQVRRPDPAIVVGDLCLFGWES